VSLLGAGWTLGSLKHLAEGGIAALTYYETTGWRGVMEVETGTRLPDQFHSIPGSVFPLYHVLADWGELAGGDIVPSLSSKPLKVESLAFQKGDCLRVMVASFDSDPLRVRVCNLPKQVRVKILDENNVLEAMLSPGNYRQQPGQATWTDDGCMELRLRPYSIVRIDREGA
jgi:hypothetical protein